MNHFNIEHDTLSTHRNRYIVSVSIVIYRQMLGKYPSFLSQYNTPDAIRDGYTTKFIYLCHKQDGTPAENMTKTEAEALVAAYESQYASIIKTCEDTGDWSNCPIDFSKLQLIFSK